MEASAVALLALPGRPTEQQRDPRSRNSRVAWTTDRVQQLRNLATANTPGGVMSIKLGRSQDSIRSKARSEGISLAPPNRSPYGDMS